MNEILVLVFIGLVWLVVNIYTGERWLKILSIVLMVGFLLAASYLAFNTFVR